MSKNRSKCLQSTKQKRLRLLKNEAKDKILELLPPGSFAKLDDQPIDLPPFQIINCKAGRCLVRQQSWGQYVHWEVEHYKLKSA